MKMIWFICVMAFTVSLNAMTTLSLNGATIGVASKQDRLIWHNVSKLSCDELTELCWRYFQQYLEPAANARALTDAEYRMLLLCAFSEMCNASALRTELVCVYDRDDKEYGCGFSYSYYRTIDKERLSRIEASYASRNYRLCKTYKRFVLEMRGAIYDDFRFKDEASGVQLPTETDNLIIKTVLSLGVENKTTIDKTVKRKMLRGEHYEDLPFLEFLENKHNKNAILWDKYKYLSSSSQHFPQAWIALRKHYNHIVSRLSSYYSVIKRQANEGDLQVAIKRREYAHYWGRDIEDIRVKLHRCVYDAPYLLLTTFLSRSLGTGFDGLYNDSAWDHFSLWINRSDKRITQVKALVLTYLEKMGNPEDVMANLTTRASTLQTIRVINLLKALLGKNSYNALREEQMLLKWMERVGQGKWEE